LALQPGGQTPRVTAMITHLSGTEVYLDANSFLPIAFAFNTHPDTDASIDIPVEVEFSDYRPVNGVEVPFHIQKFLQGELVLDFAATNAALNTGLNDSDFSLGDEQ
jgi:hypothetical protein